MYRNSRKVKDLIASAVGDMGYELAGVEFHARPEHSLLRVYIDSANGITLDDCQRVSHQLGGILDVEDVIASRYTLEVSSPGLDRPLSEPQHFTRFAGSEVRIQLRELLDGRRKLVGRLIGMREDDVVIVDEAGREWRVPLERIEKARLVPEL